MADKPPESASVLGVLDRVLAFMTSPWKAVAVVVLVIVCGGLYVIYLERARIADAVLSNANRTAFLNEDAFIRDAPKLLRDTRSDMVLLVELNLADNLMIDRIGIDQDGNRWVPATGPQRALLPNSAMPLLVKFLDNEMVCTDTSIGVNEDIIALASKGFARACIIAVPPILGVQVGGLVAAWKQPLAPAAEQRIGYVMKAASMKFATW